MKYVIIINCYIKNLDMPRIYTNTWNVKTSAYNGNILYFKPAVYVAHTNAWYSRRTQVLLKKKKEKKKDRTTGKDMIRADEGYLLVEMVNTLSLWLQLLRTGWDETELRGQQRDKTWSRKISRTGVFQSSRVSYLHPRWRRGLNPRTRSSLHPSSSHLTNLQRKHSHFT